MDRSLNSSLSNWLPRSVTTCREIPKRETHIFRNANDMVVAEVSCKDVASTHLVVLSMHVNWGCVYTIISDGG